MLLRRAANARPISFVVERHRSPAVLYGRLMLVRILIIAAVALFLVLWVRATLDVFTAVT